MFRQRDAEEAHDPVDSEVGNGPCRKDPEWGRFAGVIGPQVGLDAIHSYVTCYQPGLC